MEMRTSVNGYEVITESINCKFQTWVRDKEGKAIDFYRCRDGKSFKQFHEESVERFKKEMNDAFDKAKRNCKREA